MMRFKIVSDSSADLTAFSAVPFASVPLKITTSKAEFVDNAELDVSDMIGRLEKYSGRSGSACPNVNDWLDAFADAENIFCVTITSGLSGSYNSACIAANEYLQAHPERHVYVIDTLSTGPESAILIEKLGQLILAGKSFDEIVAEVKRYQNTTHLIFALESLHNLANNGRVNRVVGKITGLLGIRIVGKASLQGTLEITNKVRGAEKTIVEILKNMEQTGYNGGKVRIHHCENRTSAESLCNRLLQKFPKAEIIISTTRALCSFYAERGGLLVGYEGACKKGEA